MYESAVTLLQRVLMRFSREVRRAPTQVFTPPPPLDLSSVAFIPFCDLVAGGSYLTSFLLFVIAVLFYWCFLKVVGVVDSIIYADLAESLFLDDAAATAAQVGL